MIPRELQEHVDTITQKTVTKNPNLLFCNQYPESISSIHSLFVFNPNKVTKDER